MSTPRPLPQQVHDAIERGQLDEAVRLLRQAAGISLKAAKQRVDAHHQALQSRPPAAAPPPAQAPGAQPSPASLLRLLLGAGARDGSASRRRSAAANQPAAKQPDILADALEAQRRGLSPGEVPPSSSGWFWPVVLSLAVLLAAYLFRRLG
jgi:hypothetical protein